MIKFLKLLVLLPIGAAILAFSIANRMIVTISFDPFSPLDSSSAFVKLPLFAVLFITLILGVIVGGTATWFSQGRYRRRARDARDEAGQWQEEAERLRERMPAPALTGRALIR